MRNSKLFRLIGVLSNRELEKLSVYLSGAYNNSNKLTLQLYDYIFEHRQQLAQQKFACFNKRVVYAVLFDRPYDDLKIRRVMSCLTRQIEDFLIAEELKSGEQVEYRNKLLIESLSKRNDYDKFKRETESRIRQLENRKYKKRSHYLDLAWLYEKLYTHPQTKNFTAKTAADRFDGLIRNLDEYITFSKLFWGLECKTRQSIFEETHSDHFVQEALALSHGFKDDAGRYGLLRMLLRMDAVNPENAGQLKEQIHLFLENYAKKSGEIPESDFLLNALITTTIKFLNNNGSDMNVTLLQLYQFGLSEGLLLQNGLLRGIHYTSIAIQAAYLKQFDWAHDFLENYSSLVPDDEKDYAVNLAYAYWHFHKGVAQTNRKDLLKAQEYLSAIPYKLLENDLRIRSLHLRILYEYEVLEQKNENILLDNYQAFKAYLSRNQELSVGKKHSYTRFIDALKLLTQLQMEQDPKKMHAQMKKLKSILNGTDDVISKPWLLAKINDYEGKTVRPFSA